MGTGCDGPWPRGAQGRWALEVRVSPTPGKGMRSVRDVHGRPLPERLQRFPPKALGATSRPHIVRRLPLRVSNFTVNLAPWLHCAFNKQWLEANVPWKDFGNGSRMGRLGRDGNVGLVLYHIKDGAPE